MSRILANSTCWPTTPTNIISHALVPSRPLRFAVSCFPKKPLARRVSSASASLAYEALDPAISSLYSLTLRSQTRPPLPVHFSPSSTTGSHFPASILPGLDTKEQTRQGGRSWRGATERPAADSVEIAAPRRPSVIPSWAPKFELSGHSFFLSLRHCSLLSTYLSFVFRP